MKKTLFYFVPSLATLAMLFASCQKEPTVSEIQATINGYSVTFSVVVSDVDTYLWNFGDTKTSTEAAPVHEYLSSGSYTVNLTVTGRGGEGKATKLIEILPSITEMLTGGPAATNGKTWVLSSGYTQGMDGGGAIDNSMLVILPSLENMLNVIGLGEEYDNEFTFYSDGRYIVDVKNGIALTTGIYGMFTGTTVNYGNENNNLSIYGATYTAPASATWTLHAEDLVVDAITNPLGTEVPAPHENKTITGKKWVSLSEGAFFGILDFPTTRKFIIKEITPDKMYVALFICGYFADESAWSIPEYLFHVTYIPKK
ncbi:MAG: PKD domain-containing protein [Porphyromonadaceae bacterium]|nr:MAG: PKD domain-containing protein [Porphyromonadaceae bacterium]